MATRRVWSVFTVSLVLVIAHLVWLADRLPGWVAAHFGPGGQADGWASRGAFLVTYGATIALLGLLFLGLAALVRQLPPRLVNLPDREYWLAPSREAASRRRLGGQLLLVGALTNLFILGLMETTLRANLAAAAVIDARLGMGAWVVLGAYLATVLTWTVWMMTSWHAPDERTPDQQVADLRAAEARLKSDRSWRQRALARQAAYDARNGGRAAGVELPADAPGSRRAARATVAPGSSRDARTVPHGNPDTASPSRGRRRGRGRRG